MNYLFAEAAIAFSAGHRVRRETGEGRAYAPWPGIDGRAYAAKIDHLLRLYPWPIQLTQLNLHDSHDTSRFVTIANDDRASVRLGTLLLFTFPGAPSIYYGDEIGLTGALPPDHWARKTFPWDHPQCWDLDMLASTGAHRAPRIPPRPPDRRLHPPQRRSGRLRLHPHPEKQHADHRRQRRRGPPPVRNTADRLPACAAHDLVHDGRPTTTELAPGALMLTLPARGGAVFDASPAPNDRA